MLNSTFSAAYEAKGIRAVICSKTVNLGTKAWRDFLWVELIDVAQAGPYKPGQAMKM